MGESTLREMLQTIRHRGPDDEGVYLEGSLALGMRRLSIIDLVGGKQPIYNEDRSVAVVFNGEIYNYREIAERLRERGHKLATASDTEVIAHLYEDMGDDCVHELRGMFGFAVWDAHRRRLLLARDRLGIKPLYYTYTDGLLIFSSEIKAILQHPRVTAEPNLDALSNFLSLKYVPAPQTMFAGIQALPPGHLLICDPQQGVQVMSYWDLTFTRKGPRLSEEEYAQQLESLLRESVRLHLVSDVPFGAFLSGGVDSSTIVALMSQFLDEPVRTFSVGFEGPGSEVSELPYARLVADRYGTEHHEVLVGPQDLVNLSEKLIWHMDQPIADEAVLANYMVSELASQHVKMVLTGEGGDELFAGYARYSGERLSPLFRRLPRSAKKAMLAASGRISGARRQKIALYALCKDTEIERVTSWFPLFNKDMKAALLSEQLRGGITSSAEQIFAEQMAHTDARDPLSRMLYMDTKLWLPDDLLARGDKTSMATSLEARVPLLDHKLVEFAGSLPPDLKIKGLTRKYLLRKVAQSWLPPEILTRKKQGFPIPVSIWFRNEARPFLRDVLSQDAIRRRGLFSPVYVERLLREHETGFADHGSLLWGLLGVELWYRQFIDTQVTAPQGVA